MKCARWSFTAVMAAGLLAGTAIAQPREAPAPRQSPRAGSAFMEELKHMGEDDVRTLVETVRMVRLSQELGLTDEQTVVLVRQYNEIKEETARMHKERQEHTRQLRELVAASASDDEIEAKLAELIEIDKRVQMMRFDVFERAAPALTATQKAKLYMFMGDFERHMRLMIERARERFREQRGERDGPPRERSPRREFGPQEGPGDREGFGRRPRTPGGNRPDYAPFPEQPE